mgnify:CR=1 FL=1
MQMRSVILVVFLVAVTPALGWACSLPVFRYALEHWPSDPYRILIIPAEKWRESDEADLRWLAEQKRQGANIDFRKWDGDATIVAGSDARWFGSANPATRVSRFVVFPPASAAERSGGTNRPVGVAPWSQESLAKLLNSPIRQELTERLLRGEVVWVFLESGNASLDDPIAALLKDRLAHEQRTLRLPEILPGDRPLLRDPTGELAIRFSIVRVRRSDPAEGWLIEQLLSVEADLRDPEVIRQPMVFPVFGRGRALYALTGKGINAETIHEAARFLTGACQCTVKAENPGVDLLLAVSWEDAVQKTPVAPALLPPLVGLGLPAQSQANEGIVSTAASATGSQVEIASESGKEIPGETGGNTPPLIGVLWYPALFLLGLAGVVTSMAIFLLRRA